jgi:hypothetical protein
MKTVIFGLAISSLTTFGVLQAHPDHENLPEEPTKLYLPSDTSDIFAIQLDSDELEDEQELDYLEELEKKYQEKKPAAPRK